MLEIVSGELDRIRMVDGDIPFLSVEVDSPSAVPYLELNRPEPHRNDFTGRKDHFHLPKKAPAFTIEKIKDTPDISLVDISAPMGYNGTE